jgi:hypothetical protein
MERPNPNLLGTGKMEEINLYVKQHHISFLMTSFRPRSKRTSPNPGL